MTITGKHVHSDHYVLQNMHTTVHTLQRHIISTLLFWFHAAAKAQFLSLLVKAVHVVPQILGPIHFGPLRIKILFRYPHCILKSKKSIFALLLFYAEEIFARFLFFQVNLQNCASLLWSTFKCKVRGNLSEVEDNSSKMGDNSSTEHIQVMSL